MSFEVEFVEGADYVSGSLVGELTEAELEAARSEMNAQLVANSCSRLLVDATGISRMQSIITDFEFTTQHQSQLPPSTWHAVVIRAEHKEHMQFVEDVAQNRGVNLRLFTDKNHAVEWLRGD